MHCILYAALLAFLGVGLTLQSAARAEDALKLELAYADIESEGPTPKDSPSPRRECTPRYMAGPGVGIPLGLGTAGLGCAFVFSASVPYTKALSDVSNQRALGIAGAVMIPVGIAAFIYSSGA